MSIRTRGSNGTLQGQLGKKKKKREGEGEGKKESEEKLRS
jgi:hypothetical protein